MMRVLPLALAACLLLAASGVHAGLGVTSGAPNKHVGGRTGTFDSGSHSLGAACASGTSEVGGKKVRCYRRISDFADESYVSDCLLCSQYSDGCLATYTVLANQEINVYITDMDNYFKFNSDKAFFAYESERGKNIKFTKFLRPGKSESICFITYNSNGVHNVDNVRMTIEFQNPKCPAYRCNYHGKCFAETFDRPKCQCDKGYTFESQCKCKECTRNCDTCACGKCTACKEGWFGSECTQRGCPAPIPSSAIPSWRQDEPRTKEDFCSGHGECTDSGCVCVDGAAGQDCATCQPGLVQHRHNKRFEGDFACLGCPKSDGHVCGGPLRGTCRPPGSSTPVSTMEFHTCDDIGGTCRSTCAADESESTDDGSCPLSMDNAKCCVPAAKQVDSPTRPSDVAFCECRVGYQGTESCESWNFGRLYEAAITAMKGGKGEALESLEQMCALSAAYKDEPALAKACQHAQYLNAGRDFFGFFKDQVPATPFRKDAKLSALSNAINAIQHVKTRLAVSQAADALRSMGADLLAVHVSAAETHVNLAAERSKKVEDLAKAITEQAMPLSKRISQLFKQVGLSHTKTFATMRAFVEKNIELLNQDISAAETVRVLTNIQMVVSAFTGAGSVPGASKDSFALSRSLRVTRGLGMAAIIAGAVNGVLGIASNEVGYKAKMDRLKFELGEFLEYLSNVERMGDVAADGRSALDAQLQAILATANAGPDADIVGALASMPAVNAEVAQFSGYYHSLMEMFRFMDDDIAQRLPNFVVSLTADVEALTTLLQLHFNALRAIQDQALVMKLYQGVQNKIEGALDRYDIGTHANFLNQKLTLMKWLVLPDIWAAYKMLYASVLPDGPEPFLPQLAGGSVSALAAVVSGPESLVQQFQNHKELTDDRLKQCPSVRLDVTDASVLELLSTKRRAVIELPLPNKEKTCAYHVRVLDAHAYVHRSSGGSTAGQSRGVRLVRLPGSVYQDETFSTRRVVHSIWSTKSSTPKTFTFQTSVVEKVTSKLNKGLRLGWCPAGNGILDRNAKAFYSPSVAGRWQVDLDEDFPVSGIDKVVLDFYVHYFAKDCGSERPEVVLAGQNGSGCSPSMELTCPRQRLGNTALFASASGLSNNGGLA